MKKQDVILKHDLQVDLSHSVVNSSPIAFLKRLKSCVPQLPPSKCFHQIPEKIRLVTISKAKPHRIKIKGERATNSQPLLPLWLASGYCLTHIKGLIITRNPPLIGLFLSSRTDDVQRLDWRWGPSLWMWEGAEGPFFEEFETSSMLDMLWVVLKAVDQQLPQSSWGLRKAI